jgi:UDP-N-acetylglucosamine 2-epimerase
MPEEINRLLSDHLSTLLFCPTANAVRNLSREGIRSLGRHDYREEAKKRPRKGIHEPLVVNSGDVMYDLALETAKKTDRRAVLQKFRLPEKGFILATIHRAENTDRPEKLGSIIQALNDLAANGMPVFFPMHPRTRNVFKAQGLRRYARHPRFKIHGPVTYPEMIALEAEARLIITDSGGVQKEGYFFKTPCLIPRWKSEWPELLASGWNVLSGSERRNVFAQAMILCNFPGRRRWKNYFGQGQAADTIARTIKSY